MSSFALIGEFDVQLHISYVLELVRKEYVECYASSAGRAHIVFASSSFVLVEICSQLRGILPAYTYERFVLRS